MSANTVSSILIRFPLRRVAVLITRERDGGGWLCLAGEHGWLSGSLEAARYEAKWLAKNLAVPIREMVA
jgi:hypothetical protein